MLSPAESDSLNRAIAWNTRILQSLVCFPTFIWTFESEEGGESRRVGMAPWRGALHVFEVKGYSPPKKEKKKEVLSIEEKDGGQTTA